MMFFDDNETAVVKPGVQRATIVAASEDYFQPFDAETLTVKLRFENGAEMDNRIKTEYSRVCAAIVRAAGIEPRGEIDVADLVGATVLVTVEINDRGYPRCTHWAAALNVGGRTFAAVSDGPRVAPKKQAGESTLTKVVNAAEPSGDRADFPF
jgi:hypothetical protein